VAPWVVTRLEALRASARPRSRRRSFALPRSPLASSRARLASIIPAPVALRSEVMSAVVMSDTLLFLPDRGRLGPAPAVLAPGLGDLAPLGGGRSDEAGHELGRADGVVGAGGHQIHWVPVAGGG